MKKDKNTNNNTLRIISFFVLLLALILPIVLYVYQFGFELSVSHQRWAEFGSAMSGIYSPLIAFLALLILIGQFKSQVELNTHQYDQTYINASRNELNYFTEKIEASLELNHKSGLSIRKYLEEKFVYLDKSQLNEQAVKNLAAEFRKEHKIILDMWLAIYPLLEGLNANKFFPYKSNFTGAVLRITCSLSIETCTAIDNFYYVVTNNIQKGNYYFTRAI